MSHPLYYTPFIDDNIYILIYIYGPIPIQFAGCNGWLYTYIPLSGLE